MKYMETYDLSLATKKIYDSRLQLFTTATLRDILGIQSASTRFSALRRLTRSGVLEKLERDKYCLISREVNEFTLASFLYTPSYISFETALNFYGILSQFPYEITSATIKKPKQKKVHDKLYSYIRIQKSLFWGFKKEQQYLIAEPEKALLDQLYLVSKGLRSLHLDELDLSRIRKNLIREYSTTFPQTKSFLKLIKALSHE